MQIRYWSPEMRSLWDGEDRKFQYWLKVEIAVLEAREELGQIPKGVAERVQAKTYIDSLTAKVIHRRDKAIAHDLNAFVEVMRTMIGHEGQDEIATMFKLILGLPDDEFNEEFDKLLGKASKNPDAGLFHDGMTSYDTEEPAMSMLLQASCRIISEKLNGLGMALRERAVKHRGQLMMGRTHGQHAQPITLGIKFLNYLDMVERNHNMLAEIATEAAVMKLSGAVGVYGTLGPDVEEKVGEKLGLEPVIATQILSLDYRARILNELAIGASVAEKIAHDLWLLSQSEIGEVREPFGSRQKGSSAMPHKKNPITLEKICGLAVLVRNYAQAILSKVATANERDIGHSSVERLAVVDAFGIYDHMLTQLTRVVENMDVFPEVMQKNLDANCGIIASQALEMLLKRTGFPAEAAYRQVQDWCFEARSTGKHLRGIIMRWNSDHPEIDLVHNPELQNIFDWKQWVKWEDHIYQRAGL